MKPKERKKLAKEAHRLWIERSLEMWGNVCYCLAPAIQMHHFITRSRCSNLAYNPKNAVPLCKICHYKLHFTKDTLEHRRLEDTIINRRGKAWLQYIERESKKRVKTNRMWYEGIIKELGGEL